MTPAPLQHGGQLHQIAKQFNRPIEQWLDLSTGISPYSYPIPHIPLPIWQALPHVPETLMNAARQYYKTEHVLVSHGSQQIIELLPKLWLEAQKALPQKLTVFLPKVGYKEHQRAWQLAGFELRFYDNDLPSQLPKHAVVVVINPNNPSGMLWHKTQLIALEKTIAAQQGLLVIDEAFMDVITPCQSMASQPSEHTLVLRSFGKFFGLAGIRIGFVCSSMTWQTRLKTHIGPWQVNGPALYIAEHAFKDKQWQSEQQLRLTQQQAALCTVLSQKGLNKQQGCPLFVTTYCAKAQQVYQWLCQQGVYVRLTDEQDALRFGIPTPAQLTLLQTRLTNLNIDAL